MSEETNVPQESLPAEPVEQASQPVEGQTQDKAVTTEVSPAEGQPPKVVTPEEVNWKNRAMEYERKLRETVENIPNIIQETVSKAQPKKQEPEYSIADLKAFVDTTDDVANKKWAYAEIDRLESERIAKTVSDFHQRDRAVNEAQLLRKQVEQQVLSDARFADAFVDSPNGKQWNMAHPLTQSAQRYIQDPALSSRPDGLAIAMKLAYADYATQGVAGVEKKLIDTKSEVAKLKQRTLADGGGMNNYTPKVNPIAQAQADLAKTGSKTALRTLTQHILKQQGLI